MNSVWVRWSGLALLDDVAATVYVSRLGEALTRAMNHKAAAGPGKATASTTPGAPNRATPNAQATALMGKALARSAAGAPASSKFFSSAPSLRQMMNEYNRPTSRLAPIKTAPTKPASGTYEFEFDEIDFIELAAIPGRILRPSSSS